jgi:hypothetical protein
MLPMNCYYFRFDPLTQSDGSVIYAPPNFSTASEYFFGYDLSQFAVNYAIVRDVDNETDAFTITIDKYFFNNPYNNSTLAATKSTDILNAFQPTVNHVIVIGALPASFTSGSTTENMGNSYNYDDNELFSSPLVGMITNYVDTNSGYSKITCVSLLKALNDYTLGTNFSINDTDDRINQLQIYYDYNSDSTQTSAPYFPAINPSSYDTTTGRYKITLAENTNIEDIPHFPEFNFKIPSGAASTGTQIIKNGYESPKIAWRLLQEMGWCRASYYGSAVINATGLPLSSNLDTGNHFINPYQIFTCDPAKYNENTMISIGQNSKVMFKSFDTDGLRYDYTFVGDITDIQYSQSYNESFDPSKQSILYNLKTLAEGDGNYIYLTCCPRIEQASDENFPEIVWDASVYLENGNDIYGNLGKWGVYSGFRPKVMIKANPKFEGVIPDRKLYYGIFNENPLTSDTSATMAQSASWTSDNENTINKIQIEYGQTLDGNESYVEVPALTETPAFYTVYFTGSVVNSGVSIDLYLILGMDYPNQFELTRSYSVGVTASEIVEDLYYSYTGTDVILQYTENTLIIQAPSLSSSMINYWNSQDTPEDNLIVTLSYLGTIGTELSYVVQYLGDEPYYFGEARLYQKQFGIKQTKISLPEVYSLRDVFRIADKIFEKLAQPKYRLQTSVNDIAGAQLPLFEYFEVIDTSNTKQVFDDKGARIEVAISGSATSDGVLTITLPNPYVQTPQTLSVNISNAQTSTTIMNNVYTTYYPNLPLLTSIYTPTLVVTATSLIFQYGTEVAFNYTDAFDYASAGTSASGLILYKNVKAYAMFTTATYDEYLLLLDYQANSKNSVHTCIFGLPNESIANIVNQIQGWIGDIAKST